MHTNNINIKNITVQPMEAHATAPSKKAQLTVTTSKVKHRPSPLSSTETARSNRRVKCVIKASPGTLAVSSVVISILSGLGASMIEREAHNPSILDKFLFIHLSLFSAVTAYIGIKYAKDFFSKQNPQ